MSSFKNFSSMLNDLQRQADGRGTLDGSAIEDFLSIAGYEQEGGGGGGGGDYKTVKVSLTVEKLYCSLGFQPKFNEITEINDIVEALYDNGSYLEYTFNWGDEVLAEHPEINFLMLTDSFELNPYADYDNPSAVTVTGDAVYDPDTHKITVSGDCSIHLIGFDDGV